MLAGCEAPSYEQYDNVAVVPAQTALRLAALWGQRDLSRRVSQPDVSQHSMADAIRENDIVLLERYTGGHIARYSIVSYGSGTLHRVLDETADAVYISGDGNQYSDGWIPKAQVHYVVVLILRPTGAVRLPVSPNRG